MKKLYKKIQNKSKNKSKISENFKKLAERSKKSSGNHEQLNKNNSRSSWVNAAPCQWSSNKSYKKKKNLEAEIEDEAEA